MWYRARHMEAIMYVLNFAQNSFLITQSRHEVLHHVMKLYPHFFNLCIDSSPQCCTLQLNEKSLQGHGHCTVLHAMLTLPIWAPSSHSMKGVGRRHRGGEIPTITQGQGCASPCPLRPFSWSHLPHYKLTKTFLEGPERWLRG